MATTTWSASSNIELASVVSLDHLLGQLDTLRNPNNLFFAVRIVYELKAVDKLPVHELSAVNDRGLQFKYSATVADGRGRKDCSYGL